MLKFTLNIFISIVYVLPERLQGMLGKTLGILCYFLLRDRRRITISNVDRAYGNELTRDEKRQIVRGSFVSLGLAAIEFIMLPEHKERLYKRAVFDGENYLREALAAGKGVILIVPHMGNWEIGGALLPEKGIRLNVIARPQQLNATNDLIMGIRREMGVNVITKKNALKESLKVLKKGEVLAMLIDQNSKKNSVVADFFGIPAKTVASPAVLSLKTGCPVLPAFIVRKCYNQFQGVFEKPVYPERTEDMESDVQRLTQQYNDIIEKQVRRYPQQWMWCHRRWRVKEKRS